ncbi:MAG: GAF domain-containing protein [Bacteroidota bacterium]
MDTTLIVTKTGKADVYEEILPQLRSLLEGEDDWIANLANASSVLRFAFPDRISWAGFYLKRGDGLVLGPFQGKPACVRIAIGRGVCGTAAAERKTLVVPDVHAFPGHIACDPDSRSEIVVPMLHKGNLVGVLDLDSNSVNSFDTTDARYLEEVVEIVISTSKMT